MSLFFDYDLPFMTSEHKVIRKSVKEFAEKEVRPLAEKIDAENKYPRELFKKMAEQGYTATRIPVEYGGAGLDMIGASIVAEELARASGSAALIAGVQSDLASYPLVWFASEEQKKKYLVPLARGDKIGAFCLTEPCCGSDAAALQTRAVRDRGGYVITGTKTYITQGTVADIFIVFARTGKLEERHRGITAFIVEKDSCIETSPLEPMGFRGTGTAEIRFNECFVPEDNILGSLSDGFRIAMFTLDEARIGAAAVALGLVESAFEEAYEWTKQRIAFDKPIHKFQALRYLMVDAAMEIEAMRTLTYYAAWLRDKSDPRYVWMASVAKLFTSVKTQEIVSHMVRVLGGVGYIKGSVVERVYRDAKLLEIGEGTNEIQKWVMGKILYNELKLF